ncbi:uncharacterized protein BDZ99DRAFT_460899 [Mytilinidion resinicola]|uniref:Uncharacterized protein n=1 Tax=Mytilinidion resinicola TaxID=574789 RepID=A0A6A6YW38_9PEZI|nr:uncharacterized protein BDZ99DRAFT_460899 [Mytilinidion resinicola]KAF2812117.1 hypothetical protein BDZ99DRAFT_460899 [Mytilinidion resinicola]
MQVSSESQKVAGLDGELFDEISNSTTGGPEKELERVFHPNGSSIFNPLKRLTHADIQHIAGLLQAVSPVWAQCPRLYIVVRVIDHLEIFEDFVAPGVNDLWFPSSRSSLPTNIDAAVRQSILQIQWIVMTKSLELERGESGYHQYFDQDEVYPSRKRSCSVLAPTDRFKKSGVRKDIVTTRGRE